MLWHYLRITIAFAFPVFFRKMQVRNVKAIREKGRMFIAMNHPNAFMDPVSFSWIVFYPRTRYMARGDAFKKGLAAWALQSMGIVPIFRMRDGGVQGVKKNLESFEIAYQLLDKNQKIMVFAEGLCVQERRLRPIQKGTAKMAFSYLDRGGPDDLKIVPAGLMYSTPSKIRGDVFCQVGEPIVVKDHYEEYKKQPGLAVVKLTALIEERLSKLVPSLQHKENDVVIEQLQPILKKQFIAEHKLDHNNLEHHQQYWEYIIARLNTLTEKDPERMDRFRSEVNEYVSDLQKNKLDDGSIYDAENKKNRLTIPNIFGFVIGYPFYLIGKILNIVPYYLGKRIATKVVKGPEFFASVFFGLSALLAKLFFTLELVIVWLICRDLFCLAFYAAIKIGFGIFALFYSTFKMRMLMAFRFFTLKKRNPARAEAFLTKRKNIVKFVSEK